jgi:hypothetical protein
MGEQWSQAFPKFDLLLISLWIYRSFDLLLPSIWTIFLKIPPTQLYLGQWSPWIIEM